ncbi:MAG: hypothetical protein ACLP50_15170 [Solirubrobacteraceae bacterium]
MTVLIDTSLVAGTTTTGIEESFAVSVVTVGELRLGVLLADTPAMRTGRLGSTYRRAVDVAHRCCGSTSFGDAGYTAGGDELMALALANASLMPGSVAELSM